ncbi:MAG: hypothetical protein ACRD1Q_03765 [Vicinamibacterales bacterium]
MTRSVWSRTTLPLLLVLSSMWILPSPIAAVAPPDDLAAMIVNCVNSLSMTDAQALGVVEVYMREHPGALQNFPMSVTVRIALARACRVIGPGERKP